MKSLEVDQLPEKEIIYPTFIYDHSRIYQPNCHFTYEIVATGNIELIDNAFCPDFMNILLDNKRYETAEHYLNRGHVVTKDEIDYATKTDNEVF